MDPFFLSVHPSYIRVQLVFFHSILQLSNKTLFINSISFFFFFKIVTHDMEEASMPYQMKQ